MSTLLRQRATSPNCQSSTQRTSGESCKSFGMTPSPTNSRLARCNQDSMETIIMRRRWRWIGHVMRREQDNITRTALHWTPEGKRKRRRPRNTGAELWRQSTWGTIHKLGRNRRTWRSFVAALSATRHNGHE